MPSPESTVFHERREGRIGHGAEERPFDFAGNFADHLQVGDGIFIAKRCIQPGIVRSLRKTAHRHPASL
jgi:hypothetical protein